MAKFIGERIQLPAWSVYQLIDAKNLHQMIRQTDVGHRPCAVSWLCFEFADISGAPVCEPLARTVTYPGNGRV